MPSRLLALCVASASAFAPGGASVALRGAPTLRAFAPPLAFSGGRRAALSSATLALSSLIRPMAANAVEATPWPYSTLIEQVERGGVSSVFISDDGKQVLAIDKDGARHTAAILGPVGDLIDRLRRANVQFEVQPPDENVSGPIGDILCVLA